MEHDTTDPTTTDPAPEATPEPVLIGMNADGTYDIPEELILKARLQATEARAAAAEETLARMVVVHDAIRNTLTDTQRAVAERDETIGTLREQIGQLLLAAADNPAAKAPAKPTPRPTSRTRR